MELLELLKKRFEAAKAYTKDFHEEVQRALDDYELKDDETEKLERISNVSKRYEFRIPYIFATHESMLSSMFDKTPDLIIKGRGAKDKDKARKVEATYEYLVDKLDIEGFMTHTAWWFILTGFTTAHAAFKSEYNENPMLDEMGEQSFGEDGEPITTVDYTYNDPVLYVGDPIKEYWSPESEFSNDAKKVPYYFRTALMEVDEVKQMFDKDVEADTQLTIGGLKESKDNDDIKRVNVHFYYGQIPSSNKSDVKDWEYGKAYFIPFTVKEILAEPEKQGDKQCRLGKWHGRPNSFFGFGIGKTLREFQKELSVRRGQQLRYADIAAFPKIVVDAQTEIDEKALLDPRENIVLIYNGENKPEYMAAPDMSGTLILSEEKARQDAQFVSGLLDLSKGGQTETTVQTATGQSIFADAAEKRIRQAKRQYVRFYREVMIMLFKLCQENWDEEKVLSITDEQGNDMDVLVSKADLADINFDTDIDIDAESISINKEVLRAQAIDFYDKVKDDPLVNRAEVFKDTLRDGFNKDDPERYIADPTMMASQPLAQPQGQGGIPSNLGAVLGGGNSVGA